MSRDFRPVDLFMADRAIKEKEGHGLRDLVISRKTDEEETIVASPESPSRKAYPELGFLYDNFRELYDRYHGNSRAEALFSEMETILCEVEEAVVRTKETDFPDRHLYELRSLADIPVKTVVTEWFFGRLDGAFYYNTGNNRVLWQYLTEKLGSNTKGDNI